MSVRQSNPSSSPRTSWVERQWEDIKGNAKWYGILFVGNWLMTIIAAFIQNMTIWQKISIGLSSLSLIVGLLLVYKIFRYAPAAVQQPDVQPPDPQPAPFDARAHALENFPVAATSPIRDSNPKATYPTKIYVELVNNTQQCAEIAVSRWISGMDVVLLPGSLQLWLRNGWYPKPDGIDRLWVGPGERFRFWIAPRGKCELDELKRLCGNVGTVALRINQHELNIRL